MSSCVIDLQPLTQVRLMTLIPPQGAGEMLSVKVIVGVESQLSVTEGSPVLLGEVS